MVGGIRGFVEETLGAESFPGGRDGSRDVKFRFPDGVDQPYVAGVEADPAIGIGPGRTVFEVPFDRTADV